MGKCLELVCGELTEKRKPGLFEQVQPTRHPMAVLTHHTGNVPCAHLGKYLVRTMGMSSEGGGQVSTLLSPSHEFSLEPLSGVTDTTFFW